MSATTIIPSQKTILIVDDTPANIAVLADYLQDEGFRVLVAQDGEEGLKRAQLALPDLILLDVMMPGMNGFDTCRNLKVLKDTHDIPVIFMTALTETSDKVAGFLAGGVDYVTKPFQMEEVMARVRTHLALCQATQDLVNTHKALSVAQEELARSERHAALGSLVVGIAHELNTPIGNSLTVATAFGDQTTALMEAVSNEHGIKRSMLERYLFNADKATDILVRNLARAANLVESFKQIAADSSNLQRRNFKAGDLITDTKILLSESLNLERIRFKENIKDDLVVDSYPVPLSQVLTNVISNAIVHAFEGRNTCLVTISIYYSSPDRLVITVQDNGCGIPADHLEHVFDPFFTTKLGVGGSGLGLTIAYNIMTGILGGQIRITSEVGLGTTVELILPIHASSGDQVAWV